MEVDFGLKETSTNWLPLGVARIYSIGEYKAVAVLYFLVRCLYYVLYFLVRCLYYVLYFLVRFTD